MNTPTTIFRSLIIRLGIYLSAVVVAYLLASVTATQSVISSLGSMGVDVSFADRITMTLQDIAGMSDLFLPMVAFALLAAFMASALICRWWGRWRIPIYMLAGAVALVMIHLTLNLAFAVTPIAVARTSTGLLLQAISGAAGGFTYLYLISRQTSP